MLSRPVRRTRTVGCGPPVNAKQRHPAVPYGPCKRVHNSGGKQSRTGRAPSGHRAAALGVVFLFALACPPARLKAARPGLRHVCVLCAASHAPATACHPGATRATAPEEESEWLALCTPMQPMQAALWTLGGGRHARMGGRSPPTPVPPGATGGTEKKKKEACPKDFFFFFPPRGGGRLHHGRLESSHPAACTCYMHARMPPICHARALTPAPGSHPREEKKIRLGQAPFFFFFFALGWPAGPAESHGHAGTVSATRSHVHSCQPAAAERHGKGEKREKQAEGQAEGGGPAASPSGGRLGGSGRVPEGWPGRGEAAGSGWQWLWP